MNDTSQALRRRNCVGLSRHAEAEELLDAGIYTLQDIGPEALGPLSEAQIYLALSRLSHPTVSGIQALEPTFIGVCIAVYQFVLRTCGIHKAFN